MKRTDTLEEFLERHNACEYTYEFAKDLTLEQFHATCQRGDWMLWLFSRLQPEKENEIRLAAAHCANTVRHLMGDKRSTDLVDWLIENNGAEPPEKMREEAREAYNNTYGDVDAAAAYAALAAASKAKFFFAAYATKADSADFGDAASYAAFAASGGDDYDARDKNRRQTADICREYLPLEMWENSKIHNKRPYSLKAKLPAHNGLSIGSSPIAATNILKQKEGSKMKNKCTNCDKLQAIIESQKETHLATLKNAQNLSASLDLALGMLAITGYKPKTKDDEIALAAAVIYTGGGE